MDPVLGVRSGMRGYEINLISLILFAFLSGCTTVSYYRVEHADGRQLDVEVEVASRMIDLLKKEGFKPTDSPDSAFHGMTGLSEGYGLELVMMFERVKTVRSWLFYDERDVMCIYLVRLKKALTVITFSPRRSRGMGDLNMKIGEELRPFIDKKEIQIITRSHVLLD
jgi:hypothetical protein